MARSIKTGLEYFPFDIDLFNDLKVRKLIKAQSGKAVTVYACLLCSIYKRGYYMQWDNELPFYISELTGFEEVYIREVINSCVVFELLSKELFEEQGILTSRGIQERYTKICELAKRKSRIREFNLINSEEKVINPEEMRISSEEMPVSSELMQQRKVKKRKENIPPIIPPSGESVSSEEIPDDSGHIPPAGDAGRSNMPPEDVSGRVPSAVDAERSNTASESESGRSNTDFLSYISRFNGIKGSKYRAIDKVKRAFNARLKEGFTVDDMLTALQNAMKERYHIESGFRYLTPEFFTRPDKIEQHGNAGNRGNPESPAAAGPVETGAGVWIQGGRKFYGDRDNPVEIPLNAPKRPDRNHFYNPRKNAWEI
jgi:hypothetical protein